MVKKYVITSDDNNQNGGTRISVPLSATPFSPSYSATSQVIGGPRFVGPLNATPFSPSYTATSPVLGGPRFVFPGNDRVDLVQSDGGLKLVTSPVPNPGISPFVRSGVPSLGIPPALNKGPSLVSSMTSPLLSPGVAVSPVSPMARVISPFGAPGSPIPPVAPMLSPVARKRLMPFLPTTSDGRKYVPMDGLMGYSATSPFSPVIATKESDKTIKPIPIKEGTNKAAVVVLETGVHNVKKGANDQVVYLVKRKNSDEYDVFKTNKKDGEDIRKTAKDATQVQSLNLINLEKYNFDQLMPTDAAITNIEKDGSNTVVFVVGVNGHKIKQVNYMANMRAIATNGVIDGEWKQTDGMRIVYVSDIKEKLGGDLSTPVEVNDINGNATKLSSDTLTILNSVLDSKLNDLVAKYPAFASPGHEKGLVSRLKPLTGTHNVILLNNFEEKKAPAVPLSPGFGFGFGWLGW